MRAALLAVVLTVAPAYGDEEEHAAGQYVCVHLADYALVARALAEDPGVTDAQADAILG